MNELIANTLTVTFEDEAGRHFSHSITASVEIVEDEPVEEPAYFENIASNHK